MKHFISILFITCCCFLIGIRSEGQVVTVTNPLNTTPNLAANYGSLALAINALNGITTISGPVIINLNPSNNQTTPAGGFVINFTAVTTAVNTVTIEGSGNTLTAFNPQVSGRIYDAIFTILGSDYVTIQNFIMRENPLNATTTVGSNNMTEWGVALLHLSPTNGAQNNTIQNNSISLNKAYSNTFGIYSNTNHNQLDPLTPSQPTSITGANSNNKIYGNAISNVNMGICFVGSLNVNFMDLGNDIGGTGLATGNTITNWGGISQSANYFSSSGTCYGVNLDNQKGENASYNTITSASVTGAPVSMRGIFKDYNTSPTGTFTSNITNNTITITNGLTLGVTIEGINARGISTSLPGGTINISSNLLLNNSMSGATTPNFIGINCISAVGALNINSNIISGTSSAAATGSFTGISNTGAAAIVNINSNIIRGTTSTSANGNFTGISSNAAVTTILNINGNKIGDALGNAITYSVANSGNLTGINVPTVGAAASVSISSNNFQGFAQTVAGTGAHTYINLNHSANTASIDNINSNAFTNLTANTSGNVTFIIRDGIMAGSSGAAENCKSNGIVTGFSKPAAGGTVTLYSALGGSLSGTSMVQTGNDFSNISLTGATVMAGWVNYEGGGSGPAKTISNNTFTNWVCGTAAVNVIQSSNGDNGTIISANTISNISGTGGVTAIAIASGNKGALQSCSGNTISLISAGTGPALGIVSNSPSVSAVNINGNKISGLSSSFAASFTAIRIINAATVSVVKNKIYDISGGSASSLVSGIDVQSTNSGTCNIYNNCIGDLRAPVANSTNAIRGIIISSLMGTATHNVYYNSIYLNATSSGPDFGTSGLFVGASGTATSGPTTLRNNIIINRSVANGTAFTVAYRRTGVWLNNYAAASNNNIFYAGTPSSNNFIFHDGSSGDQTLAAYKARATLSPRDAASFTESTAFLSTTGSSPDFLHIDPAVPTQAESGAVNITGYTDDFDADIRQGNPGYGGTGTAPDIGADESEAIFSELIPAVITYTAITSPTCTFTGMTITGVTITDATGVALSGTTRPRIYYRKNAGAWFSAPGTNTSGTINNSVWSFTIVESDMGSLAGGDIISYYIIAQDLNAVPNVVSNPATGLVATSVNTITTHPSSPNTYLMRYDLSGTYTVGIGGDFTTLTAAVNAYNTACAISGATVFELTDNSYPSETFPIAILPHPDASAANTLTIRPSATASPLITGVVAGAQIINLNGARYIIFDGRQAGTGTTKSLTLANNSSTGIVMQFINDAQNNVLKYCNVKGMRVSNFTGTILFSTAATGTGNDNNTIDNNDITDAGGQPTNGVCSIGTAGQENDNISITNNNISNYFNPSGNSCGIYISSNSNSWTITGNRFFQSATRVYTSGNPIVFGIYITTGTNGKNYTINNNIIGFANASGTGTTNLIGNTVTLAGFPSAYSPSGTGTSLRCVGIGLSVGSLGPASNVDGNTIGGIAMYTSNTSSTLIPMFCAIYVESGTVNIGANSGNTIGSTSGTNSIYVATTGNGGTFFGIKANNIITAAIQNNTIGAITISSTSAAVSGSFTGISAGGFCNYTVSNNSIGNAVPDNIRMGYALSGGQLSNTGTLTATNAGVITILKGISSGSSGNTLSVTNNILRGWVMSCSNATNTLNLTGIETTGVLAGGNPSVNVNNNFFGTASTNWVNSTVNNLSTFYGINMANTNAAVSNIKDNDFTGTMFGTQNAVGGGLIRLTGASSPNNIATISGNTFTNLGFRFSSGDLYFIYTGYTIASTGQLIIDNNRTVGTFSGTGTAIYHIINLFMGSAAGAKADITNNNFSNMVTTGANSGYYLLYTSFSVNPCLLTVSGNTFNNISFSNGSFVNGIDIADMTGTANCSNNTLTNFTGQGFMTGITLDPSGSTGQFNVTNNTISGLLSTGAGGFINGITARISPVNATQTTIDQNTISGFSSTNLNGDVAGIYLDNGFASSTVSVTKNKIYDLSESAIGSNVYGINNYTSLRGIITYSNNYIGDLRAPVSNVNGPAVTGIKLFMLSGQANVYYNTVYLNAAGTAPVFSTAAIYADAATAVTLRNNIFSNVSSHGATGKTVAYWRGDTNLGTYNAASNNNLFYAGTTSAQNLIFYDGTNSDQTLATYKSRVTPRDNLSVSANPAFISTTGSNVNFLHISATGNCSVNATGSNAGILLSTDYDNDLRSIASPFVTDIGADEFSRKNAWTGANGTNWNDPANWSEGIVPNSIDENVVISSPPVNQPIIALGETHQVGSVIIGTGANLTNYGTVKVAGYIYGNPASINNIQAGIVQGSVELNGNCSTPQSLAGNVFVNNAVKNFIVGNDVNVSAVAGENLNISRALSFGAVTGKVLATGDNIVLLSTAAATANVNDLTGNSISGKATVERFINTGTAGGQHSKGWQFLATPAQGQTIFQSWQEGGLTPAGYGTIITGTGTGFDLTTTTPSMKYYDPAIGANGAWVGVSSTAGILDDQRGYMLFVRGDRTVNTLGGLPNQTNMRIKGTIYQPNNPPPVTNVAAGKYASVGNPYASTIDLDYMKNNGLLVNLNNDAVVWDPLLYGSYGFGGYQTLAAANNYEPTAGGTSYYTAGEPSPYIQSGQAFFVLSSGSPGTVTFTEACKKDTTKLVNRLTDAGNRKYFRAGLFTNTGMIADGNAVAFEDGYMNNVDADDAIKFLNSGENFMISRNNKKLSVEARRTPETRDTIFYSLSNLRKQPYQLRFAPKNLQAGELRAYLIDKYLHTTTELNLADSNFINIDINADSLSAAADRFLVVFEKVTIVPVTFTSISANRKNDKAIQVKWNIENEVNIEEYSLEKSSDGQNFIGINSKLPMVNNGGSATYQHIDLNPFNGNNYYRVKATGLSGQVQFSVIVKVGPLQETASIFVFPNPVENKTLIIHFVNQATGNYKLQLTNQLGQVIYKSNIQVEDANITRSIILDESIAAGNYQLSIVGADAKRSVIQIIIR
ncbi:MAG: hypothetical protein ABIN36_10115 [Ferruginibacter sp.]